MSMLGISFLNEIVVEKKHCDPGQILNMLRNDVSKALKQTGSTDEQKDGMDIALCAYDPETLSLKFAGARNPLYLIRQGSLEIVPATRMTISYPYADADNFQTNTLRL